MNADDITSQPESEAVVAAEAEPASDEATPSSEAEPEAEAAPSKRRSRRDKKAEPEAEAAVEATNGFDLVGEDGRRIVRWHSFSSCQDLARRVEAASGEKTEILPSPSR